MADMADPPGTTADLGLGRPTRVALGAVPGDFTQLWELGGEMLFR